MYNRDNYIIIKSPAEHICKYKIKIKEIGEEIISVGEYENRILVFDDTLSTSNSKYIDQNFIRGRHKILDIFYLLQSYFDLPKKTKRNNSNKIINQTLKDIENIYRDVGGFYMSYEEFQQIFGKF